jgi:N-acetylmuramoyl-L-alanine amidase
MSWKTYKKSFCVAGFVLMAMFCGSAHAIALEQKYTRIKIDGIVSDSGVAIADVDGVTSLSVTGFANALGFSWKWDFAEQKLTCTNKKQKIAFVLGMPFYTIKDSLVQLAFAPVRYEGMLFLPVRLCIAAFAHAAQSDISWLPQDSTIVVVAQPDQLALADTSKKNSVDSVKNVPAVVKKETPVKPKQTQELIKTVVIDPGHGGMDPGAIGQDGTEEKTLVLAIGLQLRDILKEQNGLNVYMTRDKDVFIPLQDRTRFANAKKADIFVSIHANSIDGDTKKKEFTKGFKVYFLSQAKNEDDKLAAMRENAVIKLEDKRDRYDNLQNILIDMVGNEYLRESQDFSILITEKLHSSLRQIPKLNLGVGQANFWVLNGAYMPSVLVEVGFISNPKEEQSLKEPSVQKTIAEGIFEAITDLKKKFEAE